MGLLPGGGATISSYVAYAVAKRWSKTPQKFGHGAIAGVAAPESAANAATCSGFIPLLTLGIPDNVVMALILGAFMLHGITPGPTMMAQHPEMFWGIVTSMFIGNCILIVTMLPLIGFLAKITLIPTNVVVPDHRSGLPGRRLWREQQSDGHRHHDGIRLLGYLMTKFGFPARADGAGVRAGADHGNGAPPIADHVARRLLHFLDTAGLGNANDRFW